MLTVTADLWLKRQCGRRLNAVSAKDGGFSTGKGKSNSEATSLAVCALTSHLRKLQNKATFFNFDINDSVVFETPAPTKAIIFKQYVK